MWKAALKADKQQYGNYVLLNKTGDDKQDIQNIAGCIEKLYESMRGSGMSVDEKSIKIIVKAAVESNAGPFEEDHEPVVSDKKISVALKYEALDWKKVEN